MPRGLGLSDGSAVFNQPPGKRSPGPDSIDFEIDLERAWLAGDQMRGKSFEQFVPEYFGDYDLSEEHYSAMQQQFEDARNGINNMGWDGTNDFLLRRCEPFVGM